MFIKKNIEVVVLSVSIVFYEMYKEILPKIDGINMIIIVINDLFSLIPQKVSERLPVPIGKHCNLDEVLRSESLLDAYRQVPTGID